MTAYARLSHHGQKYRATIDDTRYRGDETNGFALRTVVAAEYERPFWLSNGANGGQKYTVSPIFRWQHDSRTKTVLTTSFQYQNSPTTMGIPVLGGHFVGPYDAWYGSPSGRLNSKSLLAMLDFERKLEKIWTIRIGGGIGYSDVDYNVWGISSSAGRGTSTADYYNQMIASGKAKYEAAWSDEWNINWNFYSNALAEFKTGQVKHEALMGVSYTGSSTYGDGSSLVTNATANTNGYFSLYNPPPFSLQGAIIPAPMRRIPWCRGRVFCCRMSSVMDSGVFWPAFAVTRISAWTIIMRLRGAPASELPACSANA